MSNEQQTPYKKDIDISARVECVQITSANLAEMEVFNSCFRPIAFYVEWNDDQNRVRSKYRIQARRHRKVQRHLLSGAIIDEEKINPDEGNDATSNTKLERNPSSGYWYINNAFIPLTQV